MSLSHDSVIYYSNDSVKAMFDYYNFVVTLKYVVLKSYIINHSLHLPFQDYFWVVVRSWIWSWV